MPLRLIMGQSGLAEKILETLVHYRTIITTCFDNNNLFDRQLQIGFQEFLNVDVGKYSMAELFANYVDKVQRKGGLKSLAEIKSNQIKSLQEKLEDHLETCVVLFTFLIDKDHFLMVYRDLLARRLLMEAYEDFESEKLFITRLKVTCGMQQLGQLQGMLNDYTQAKDETKEFESFLATRQGGSDDSAVEFKIACLRTSNWPSYKQINVSLPPNIESKFESFKTFYANKHKSRKVTVVFSLGEAIVAMRTPGRPRPHELRVSTLSMLILLLFNEESAQQGGLTMLEIMRTLGIEEDICKKNLQSLSTNKFKILMPARQL